MKARRLEKSSFPTIEIVTKSYNDDHEVVPVDAILEPAKKFKTYHFHLKLLLKEEEQIKVFADDETDEPEKKDKSKTLFHYILTLTRTPSSLIRYLLNFKRNT